MPVKRLEWYVFREVVPNFLIGAAFYVVFFLVAKLVSQPYLSALPTRFVGAWLFWQTPNFVLQALPIAVVFAVILVVGRFARENELQAAFAGGIGLSRIIRSLIFFGVFLACFGLFMAEYVVPKANQKVSVTWYDNIGTGGTALTFLAGKYITDGKNLILFDAFNAQTQELQNVRLESWDGHNQTVVLAQFASLIGSKLTLRGYKIYTLNHDFLPLPANPNQTDINQAFTAVITQLDPQYKYIRILGKSREEFIAQNTEGGFEDSRSISALFNESQTSQTKSAKLSAALLGYKTALPFANLIILLLAIPIASQGSRSSSLAFGMAVAVAVAYYILLFAGKSLGESGVVPPFLGPWLANLLFIGFGIYLLRRQQFR